ncbi:hypothetical protein [Sabulicella rubraurantiaca]|uniref:hypothetical protein n=1 Tax=Sabulicella rubraurantiaca TaxID=2811429 RepID=UPI001A9752CB|nr:hypothetical protein [Sabulicella rubraurantiaca]
MRDTVLTPPNPPFGEMAEFTDDTGNHVYFSPLRGAGEAPSLNIDAHALENGNLRDSVRISLTMDQARALRDYLNRLDLSSPR